MPTRLMVPPVKKREGHTMTGKAPAQSQGEEEVSDSAGPNSLQL